MIYNFLRGFAHILMAAAMFGTLSVSSAVAQDEHAYRLGPRETLMIRIGQWDAVQGIYTAWTDLSGEYVVAPDGTVTLPLAGAIQAEGRTTNELSANIGERLADRAGYSERIEVTVEIAEFRPIYVLGGVRSPGVYPFSPGLTVLQALGLAGGMEGADRTFLRTERNAMTSLGNYEVMQLDLLRRLATLARLQAELEEEQIEVPEELQQAPLGTEFVEREREIKAARDAELESSLSQIDSLRRLLEQQIEALTEQITLRGRQLELAQEELENTASLVERGLTVASRQIDLESRVAEQEVRRLELNTARLNAEQRLNEAARERLDLINNRRREIVEAVRTERSQIEELRVRMRTEAALYAEATRYEDGFIQPEGLGAPVLEVTRRVNGEMTTVAATRSDELQPGDVLEIRLPELETGTSTLPSRRPATPSAAQPDGLAITPSNFSVAPVQD